MSKKHAVLFFVICSLLLAAAFLCCGTAAHAEGASEGVRVEFLYGTKKYTYVQSGGSASFLDEQEKAKRGFFLPPKGKAELMEDIVKIGFSKAEAVRYVFFGIEDVVKRMEGDINREPVNSEVTFRPNGTPMFYYSEERDGFFLERELLYNTLYKRLSKESRFSLSLPVTVLKPEFSRAYYEKNICERASFSTSYESSSSDRRHNVALALRAYNGLVVQPEESVSFNRLVGARSVQRGYKTAKIILDGVYEDGVGGGVCQSSTTLYNALLIAGLKVTKRSPHSLTSSYISPGFDAMVSMGGGDLEFENNTGAPIYIKTLADASRVTVKIYGARAEYKIIRRKEIIKTLEPQPDRIIFDFEGKYADRVFFSDEYFRMQASKQGLVVDAYLDYYKGGRLVKTEKLHTDRYKPVQGVYVYGTRLRPPPPPMPEPEPLPQEFFPIY